MNSYIYLQQLPKALTMGQRESCKNMRNVFFYYFKTEKAWGYEFSCNKHLISKGYTNKINSFKIKIRKKV